ncbi:MAG: phosphoribosylformylglycinamidine synthase subunit PurL, partial [Actinomycetota bacterium]|nr:phosphoribosylformylglycinamidine synthase subunit PurL [Actinomycetota bacterium]
MASGHRLTLRSIDADPRAASIAASATALGLPLDGPVAVADIVFVEGDLDAADRDALGAFLVDDLLQRGTWDVPQAPAGSNDAAHSSPVEITFHPGVTDTAADAVLRAGAQLGVSVTAAVSGRRLEFPPGTGASTVDRLLRRAVANPIIEHWSAGEATPVFHPGTPGRGESASIPMRTLDSDGLARLGAERSLALDPAELVVIRDHFAGLGRDPTDVELETLAQTWSEHCAHKTFRATLVVDGEERPSLLGRLQAATDTVGRDFVRSAFVGNAGIVCFAEGTTLALKAETHNHPSAVEPFGGANTGVGGVIRDVMGAAHRPVALTDVLCFGPPDLPVDDLPDGALHPRRIRDGVVDGVADYGNKIGLPTIAGAVLYDEEFTTNPLVFCGCIGVAADRPLPTGPDPGDRVVVLGGRTGRDGIRGATFSSATMDATTGEVAGASVQIGDPVTEKLLIDVLDGSDELWTAITDCGAGGLSSAVGEMADGVGADVDMDVVPLKYPGLEPWEIWLSEAQERMVVAVPPAHLLALRDRCDRHGVELADLGAFTGDGRLVVRHHGEIVLDLDTAFLHNGRPGRRMEATAPVPDRIPGRRRHVGDPAATLLALLAHRNIASKAATIHRYDHEIGGGTVVRPLVGRHGDGPADGVVLADPRETHGFAVGIGVNPWYGLHDPEAMAHAAVDEAVRNVVAVGADPDLVALLDNFSWGDPRRPSTLGALVAAVDGCHDAAVTHNAPFVSGKDSLNNEYVGRDGQRHAVPPTLVITAVAHVADAGRCVTPELSEPGNQVFLLGTTSSEFAGSHLDLVLGTPAAPGAVPQPDPSAPGRYRRLHTAIRAGLLQACHDVSEGGLAVALAELCISGRLGIDVDALPHDDVATSWFAESTGRHVVEVRPADVEDFLAMAGPAHRLGT